MSNRETNVVQYNGKQYKHIRAYDLQKGDILVINDKGYTFHRIVRYPIITLFDDEQQDGEDEVVIICWDGPFEYRAFISEWIHIQ